MIGSWTRSMVELWARARGLDEGRPDLTDEDACSPGESESCAAERRAASIAISALAPSIETNEYPVLDLEDEAARAVYPHNAISKRTRHPRVDLRERYVVIVIHQMGVERATDSPRWWRVTAHRAIKPDGTRVRLHPLDVRLTAANRLDRAPFHAISIEVGGNFEANDGRGDWWRPEIYGAGRASEVQLAATRQETRSIVQEVRAEYGAEVRAIVSHRICGRDPEKPSCPGSRLHAEVVEWAGAMLGLAVPDGFRAGGLVLPPNWHGQWWPKCTNKLSKGFWPK